MSGARRYAETLKVAARSGEGIRDVVARICGAVDSYYFVNLKKMYIESENSQDLDSRMSEETDVEILPCPRTSSADTVEVQKGDTVWAFFIAALKGKRSSPWRDFRSSATTSPAERLDYFYDAFVEMNPGVNADSLTIGTKVRIPTSPSSAQAPPAIGKAPNAIEPIFALQSADTTCKSVASAIYPYDLQGLLDVLVRNKSRVPDSRTPVRVLVADSGLFGAGTGIFRDSVLTKERTSTWEKYIKAVEPWNFGSDPSHGTNVASLVLGGTLFGRVQALDSPRATLAVQRIYKKSVLADGRTEVFGVIDDVWDILDAGITKFSVDIVNLSVKTRNEIPGLKSRLSGQYRALFVAAAGNHDGALGPAHDKYVYPALYGGTTVPNLVVVAAIDSDGALTEFSNRGKEYIDLAAPGCRIPAFSYDRARREWTTELLSGTSMASPLVAFAASLIKSETGGGAPADIKRRLLVSADLRPELSDAVVDGRVLNIVKAVSLFHDVVELKEQSRLIFGSVTLIRDTDKKELGDDDPVEFQCGSQVKPWRLRDVFKLAPGLPNANNQMKARVYTRGGEMFQSWECEPLRGISVLIRDAERGVSEAYELSDVRDIVRKEIAGR
jgi:hypothetical protein